MPAAALLRAEYIFCVFNRGSQLTQRQLHVSAQSLSHRRTHGRAVQCSRHVLGRVEVAGVSLKRVAAKGADLSRGTFHPPGEIIPPADLPVQTTTKFETLLNLKTRVTGASRAQGREHRP